MSIDGILLTPLRVIDAPAGAVLHGIKKSSPGFAGFGEAYFSEVAEGFTKGWRRHLRMTLNLVVVAGSVRFVVHDDRAESGTRGVFEEHRLGRDPETYARLTVAPGLWLAFRGTGPGTGVVLDIMDGEHDPQEAETRDLDAFAYRW